MFEARSQRGKMRWMKIRKRLGFFSLILFLAFASISVALDRQPNADYRARREALAGKAAGVVVLFASMEASDDVYGFRQEDNFYYLSGVSEAGAALLIASAVEGKGDSPNRPYTEILFLPPRNPAQEKWLGPRLGPENPEAKQITGFDRVEEIGKLPVELEPMISALFPAIYTDVPAQGESPSTIALAFLKRLSPMLAYQDVKPMMASLRTVKDAGEVALIRKAVDASVAAHLAAFTTVKPGVNEREISALMQYEWGKRGCERPAYAPIVGSGFYSTVLHYSQDSNTMKAGDVVVIDAAGEYSMYAADITRTLPISGHFTARQREIYDIVLGAQQVAVAAFQSGKSNLKRGSDANSLYKTAYDYINSHGKDLHGEPLGKYFIHGLSHYIGLNVHDPDNYDVPLGPGMAFTIEPGIYIPEENLGVRIEDDFYVDAGGKLINLSGALPARAEDVEKAMAGK